MAWSRRGRLGDSVERECASPHLLRGTLLRRYKRFLADVELDDGEVVIAHCANPGSMASVSQPGSEVWLSGADRPGRSLAYSWELIRVGRALVGINTMRTNSLVVEALVEGRIPELRGYTCMRREVLYGRNSRVDVLLEAAGRPTCFVEVKNVTLKRNIGEGQSVEFPDAVTRRGTRHLAELADAVRQGCRSVMLYVAQREDGNRLGFAGDIDPEYARGVSAAVATGVELLCYRCSVDVGAIRLEDAIAIDLPTALPACKTMTSHME